MRVIVSRLAAGAALCAAVGIMCAQTAEMTPLGRYEKMVLDAIGASWYAKVTAASDLVARGTVRVQFWVDLSGKIKDVKITENSSNQAFANICLQSILGVKLPPVPEDVAKILPAKGLKMEIAFNTHR